MPDPDLYRERAHLVAHLAALYPSAIVLDLFPHVERVASNVAEWDGHSTEQKYRRLDNLTRTIAAKGGGG